MQFTTKKAAIAAGLIPESALNKSTVRQAPLRTAEPIMVRGERFFSPDDLEELVSRTSIHSRGLRLPAGVKPVKVCRHSGVRYDAYRISDCRAVERLW